MKIFNLPDTSIEQHNQQLEFCTIANCASRADSVCIYDPSQKRVELHAYSAIEQKGIPAAIYFCSRHSKSFLPPKGWALEDLRSAPEALEAETPKTKEFKTPLLNRAFRNTRQVEQI